MIPSALARALLLAAAVTAVPTTALSAVPDRTFQGTVSVAIYGPGRIAAEASGRFYVVDAMGRVNMFARNGAFMATVFAGGQSVTAGAGKLFVGTADGELVTIDAKFGRVLSRANLGVGDGPVGLSYDSVREVIWMAFRSGAVQARQANGTVTVNFSPDKTGALGTVVDVAVDAEGGVVWVARDHEAVGGMIFALAAADGARISAIGADGVGPAKVTGALALSPTGELLVADMFTGKVEVLDTAGAKLQTVIVPSAGAGVAPQPAGLAFLQNGDLVVADLFGSQLDRFGDGSALPVCEADADCDGMSDAFESAYGFNSGKPADALADADGDGLLNGEEADLGTNPKKADTDGDGYSDAAEVASGFNPLDPTDHQPKVIVSGETVFSPGLVTLSASVGGIEDPSGCTVAWNQTSGVTVALNGASSFGPSFVARKAGAYGFSAKATCGGVDSASVAVEVTVQNLAPIAATMRVVAVQRGERLQLDARRSSDANGDALSYGWEQIAGPAVASGSSTRAISVRVGSEGAYRFRVSVTDAGGAVGEAVSDVIALGAKPVPAPSAVSPVVGALGEQIALDASGSIRTSDATFAWRQVSGPAIALLDGSLPVAGFVPAVAGAYVFEVGVTQGGVSGPPARVEAYVANLASALPVAIATAPAVASVGSEIGLDGTASTGASGAEFLWRQVSGPAAGLGSADRALAKAFLFAPGSYEFELTVRDAAGVGIPTRVRVEARESGLPIPVARLIAPASAAVGEAVVLDGSGSSGANKFRWTQLKGPWVLLEGSSVESFLPSEPGTYVFELEVEGGQVRSAPVRASVVVGDGMGN